MNIRHLSGISAELEAMKIYVELGHEIFTPLAAQSRCDFIAIKGTDCRKVQVKKASWSKAGTHSYLQARLKGRNKYSIEYKDGDFDEVIFIEGNGDYWIAPWEDVKSLSSVSLKGTKESYSSRSSLYDPEVWRNSLN